MLCFLCFVLLESSGGYAETPNAFIFSLNNYESVAPFLSKVKPGYTGVAIERLRNHGPKFGADLIIPLDMKSEASLGWYYSAPASSGGGMFYAGSLRGNSINFRGNTLTPVTSYISLR